VHCAGQSLRPLRLRSTPLQAGRLHCSFPEYLLRHVSLTPPQCILDFMPHNCPFLSPYHSSICSSLTASVCQFVHFSHTLLFAPFFYVLIPTYFCAFMALSVHAFLLLCFPHGHHRFSADLTHGTASAPSSLRSPKMESRSPFQSSQIPGTLVGMVLDIVSSVMDQTRSTADSTSQKVKPSRFFLQRTDSQVFAHRISYKSGMRVHSLLRCNPGVNPLSSFVIYHDLGSGLHQIHVIAAPV